MIIVVSDAAANCAWGGGVFYTTDIRLTITATTVATPEQRIRPRNQQAIHRDSGGDSATTEATTQQRARTNKHFTATAVATPQQRAGMISHEPKQPTEPNVAAMIAIDYKQQSHNRCDDLSIVLTETILTQPTFFHKFGQPSTL